MISQGLLEKIMQGNAPIRYTRTSDRKWAAHTTLFDPRSSQHLMQVGFGRRREQAKEDLVQEIWKFVKEVYDEVEGKASAEVQSATTDIPF